MQFNGNIHESEDFSDSSRHHIYQSESEISRFPFCAINSLTWAVKCAKFNLENHRNFLDKLRKLCVNGTVIYKFITVLK